MVSHDVKLPRKKFGVLYADPPWTFKTRGRNGDAKSASRHYPTMTLEALMALQVPSICKPDATLFLWAPWTHTEQAFALAKAWGFRFSSMFLVWIKTPPGVAEGAAVPELELPRGTGYWTRGNCEPLWRFSRGNPGLPIVREATPNVIFSPIREHSRKPDRVRRLIRAWTPGPRVELFARSRSKGFLAVGNEVDRFQEGGRP